ncbi:hypothetical protein HZS_2669 [Henneguya salminicola]|nr:hypothetical protein HZS_2669 [Henneguya salminicola]
MELINVQNITHNDFQPYSWNGGSIIAISGDSYVVLACDNRMSEGYIIHSRNTSKIQKLTDKLYIAICGFHGDASAFLKILDIKIKNYQKNHKKVMRLIKFNNLLISNTLYSHRFFPYYTYIILAGIDEHGKGAVFSYDPVGSYERVTCRASGSGAAIIQPILDNQISLKNQNNPQSFLHDPLSVAKFVHDVFCSATERDIYTGDSGTLVMLNAVEEKVEAFNLRAD